MKQLAIIIDCGHDCTTKKKQGGKYSPITGMEEYVFNNGVGKYLERLCEINKIPFINVSEGNTQREVTLNERTYKANEYKKQHSDYNCVYVSIHANAGGGTGSEIWVHSKSIPNTVNLAKSTLGALCTSTAQTNRGVKYGYVTNPNYNFHVNRETDMVSMLVECGFMDSIADCYKLLDDKFREKCAVGIFKGITSFFNVETSVETVENTDYKQLYERYKDKLEKISKIIEE